MEKIKLGVLDVKKLVGFLQLAEIDAPQTLNIGKGKLSFRAYPKSKAFVKAKTIELSEVCACDGDLSENSYKWPIANTKKLINVLSLFKDKETNAFIFVDSGFVLKLALESSKSDKITMVSGDIGHVPEWLEDAVWEKLSNVDSAECVVSFKDGDVENLKKTYHVMHGVSTATKNLQRLVFVKATKEGLLLCSSNDGEDAKKNEWSILWSENYSDNGIDSEERILNLSNIMNISGDGQISIKQHTGSLKAMVFKTDITLVNILTPKS